jgi:exosortase/archaeosortase family protein
MIWLVPLFAYGAFIWYIPTGGKDLLEQAPIALGLLILYLLGTPWEQEDSSTTPPPSWSKLFLTTFLTLLAIASENTFFNTLLLTYWFILWRKRYLTKETQQRTAPLLVLFFLAFPWVNRDLEFVGWWFRYSAASLSSSLWSGFGFETHQQGTNVLIGTINLFVEPACSGLNTLQALLMAGTIAAYSLFGATRRFWWNLLIIPLAAWLSNFLRVVLLTALALVTTPSEISETAHALVGLITILFCYLLAYAFFEGQVAPKDVSKAPSLVSIFHLDALHYVLLGSSLVASSSILYAWKQSPFDEYSPVACAIWLTPILLDRVSKKNHIAFPMRWGLVAVTCLLVGYSISINAVLHLALVISLFNAKQNHCTPIAEWVWRAGAISWLPLFGIFFSPFQLQGVHILRIALATCVTLPVLLLPTYLLEPEPYEPKS